MAERKIRVLMAKKRIDVHGRATKLITRELMEAGMEVVYLRFGTPEEIVNAAVQEDVDVIGVSLMTGGHVHIAGELKRLLAEQEIDDLLLIMGGIIPGADREGLLKLGVDEVFQPGLPVQAIIDYINANLKRKVA